LAKRGRWDLGPFLVRSARMLHRLQPNVVHSYLPVPNVVAALLRPVVPTAVLVWGIRAADMDLAAYDRLSRLSYRLERGLAGAADLIIANSRRGKAHALACGLPTGRLHLIANGIDTARYRPDEEARIRLRGELGLPPEAAVIGLIARFDPMKDHATFLAAAELLARNHPGVRFVLAGQEVEDGNPALAGANVGALAGKVSLLGRREDIPQIMNALDLMCMSSAFGEGFPNVLGEAMACGVPCVATDVGDAAWILGDTGRVVPPRDPVALAVALAAQLEIIKRAGPALRALVRGRVVDNFGAATLIDRTERLLLQAVEEKRR
ncbi:MAG: glycosyltransferase, partial [Rhodospirillaceae bacterium]